GAVRGWHGEAISEVSRGGGAGGVGPHLVPVDDQAGGRGDENPAGAVGGDDVPRAGGADGVVGSRRVDVHAVARVALADGAGDVRADVVVEDQVVRGRRAADEDAAAVAADHV